MLAEYRVAPDNDMHCPPEKDMTEQTYRVAADELRQFIDRYETLEEERLVIAGQQKEVLAEAGSRGYDTKVMRKLIALRKRDLNEVAEEEAILQIYKEALGM